MSCAFYSLHMLLLPELLSGEREDGEIAAVMLELANEENQ